MTNGFVSKLSQKETHIMRRQGHVVIVILATLFTLTPTWAQSTSTLLQEGIFTEETVGDLDAAMKIYAEIVADAEQNRAYAAEAQYRLGMCSLKKGQKHDAAIAFRKLIKQFPEQTDVVFQFEARDALRVGEEPPDWFAEAGLQPGDLIIGIGDDVWSNLDAIKKLAEAPPEGTLQLRVERDGKTEAIIVSAAKFLESVTGSAGLSEERR